MHGGALTLDLVTSTATLPTKTVRASRCSGLSSAGTCFAFPCRDLLLAWLPFRRDSCTSCDGSPSSSDESLLLLSGSSSAAGVGLGDSRFLLFFLCICSWSFASSSTSLSLLLAALACFFFFSFFPGFEADLDDDGVAETKVSQPL